MPLIESNCEEDVRGLRAPVRYEGFVRRRLKVGIVQIHIAETVPGGREVDQASAVLDQLRDAIHKYEVAQVIGPELCLETILCLPDRSRHNTGICDDHIEQAAIGNQLVRSSAHALQAGKVELDHLETRTRLRRGLTDFRCGPVRFSRSRAAPTTFAPCVTSARAVSTPRPADTPVTRIRFPFRSTPARTSSVVDFAPNFAPMLHAPMSNL
jgi:hypothetical protein